MTKIYLLLELAKERIQGTLHNKPDRPDNFYLQNSIKLINEVIELIKIDNKYEEEFEDELLNFFQHDNVWHKINKLMIKYTSNCEVKIKARKGKIVIERI